MHTREAFIEQGYYSELISLCYTNLPTKLRYVTYNLVGIFVD